MENLYQNIAFSAENKINVGNLVARNLSNGVDAGLYRPKKTVASHF